MKPVEYYLTLNYRTTVCRDDEGDFVVKVPDLPGCVADGSTPDEAFKNLEGAMRSWIESRLAAGLEVPEPKASAEYSGRLVLRMPHYLHERLAQQAENEGVSLNQYMVSLLTEASAPGQSRNPSSAASNSISAGSVFYYSYGMSQFQPNARVMCSQEWLMNSVSQANARVISDYDLLVNNVTQAHYLVSESPLQFSTSQGERKDYSAKPQTSPKQQVA